MKPILHIKLPESIIPKHIDELTKDVRESVNDEYHVLLTFGLEMQVLNGQQLTELTFEEFKKQYIK